MRRIWSDFFFFSENAFSGILDDKFPLPKGLTRIDNYRPLYTSRIVWHTENEVEANNLSEHNLELDEAKKYNSTPRGFLGNVWCYIYFLGNALFHIFHKECMCDVTYLL